MSALRKIVERVYPPRHIPFYLQRLVRHPAKRKWIAGRIASFLPASNRQLVTEDEPLASTLAQRGFAMLPAAITEEELKQIKDYLATRLCYDRWRPSQRFHISDAPKDCHVAPYLDEDVLACPHLLRVANSSSVLGIVERLFGCKATISNLSVWWSLTGHSNPQEAEFFHRDVDEWHFIKLFVYLSDVDAGSGPHKFVAGSHASPKLLRIRRYTDEEIKQAFGEENIISFEGSRRTTFLENTFGFHKGQLPLRNNRLLFQVQYSLLPIGIYDYKPVDRPHGFDPYLNRLYLRQSRSGASPSTL